MSIQVLRIWQITTHLIRDLQLFIATFWTETIIMSPGLLVSGLLLLLLVLGVRNYDSLFYNVSIVCQL